MSSLSDLQTALLAADAAGDTQGAQTLATHIRWLVDPQGGNYFGAGGGKTPSAMPADPMPAPDPSTGGGTLSIGPFDTGIQTPQVVDRTLAGMGQAVSNLGAGIAQRVGGVAGDLLGQPVGPSAADVSQQRQLDAPLNATTAGTLGNVGMNMAMMAPTLAIPGSSGLVGSAALGGMLGNVQPTTSANETAANTAIGAAGGPIGLGVGRLASGLVKSAYGAVVQPFTASGRDAIVGNALNRFAGSPEDAQAAIAAMNPQGPSLLPDVVPTVGMASGNPGLATVERNVSVSPGATSAAFSARQQQNSNALLDAIRGIAGDDSSMASAEAARSASAGPLYAAAKAQTIPADDTLTTLMQRPVMQAAKTRAETLAANNGQTISLGDNGQYSVDGLHYVKMALDDMASNPATSGIGRNELAAINGSRGSLLDWLSGAVPQYGQASAAYAAGSQPINAMQIGNALVDKLSPAMNDFRMTKVLQPNAFEQALRNGDATAVKATGFPGATVENSLTPEQLATVNSVGNTLGQISDSQLLGKASGSPTVQNLITQHALANAGRTVGPFLSNNVAAQTVLGLPLNFAMAHFAEPAVQNRLAQALLNPSDAASLMQAQLPSGQNLLQSYLDQLTTKVPLGLVDSTEQRRLQSAGPQ